MQRNCSLIFIVLILALVTSDAFAEKIVASEYAGPVDRYSHFALGRPHEYARLTATTDMGRRLELRLPENEVFEDLKPRIISPLAGEVNQLLTIVSSRDKGSRLVLVGLDGDRLAISAESSPIGRSNRWLNPVGVADFDGDGTAEIAAVITPHIGGTLKVYRRQGGVLMEIAALKGFSNHIYGTAEQALSMPVLVNGRMRLLVPDAKRRQLRLVGLEKGRLVEIGSCELPSQLIGALKVISSSEVSVGLSSGRYVVDPSRCLKKRF